MIQAALDDRVQVPYLSEGNMRIVAVADTHTYHNQLSIPNGDVFIHAGDLCKKGTLWELQSAAAWIRSLPHRHKIIIAGNHDWPFVEDPLEARALFGGMHYLQDTDLCLDGVRFYGSPWQPEFYDWAFNLPRGPELADVWARIPIGLDVLITHGPAAGVGDRVGNEHVGCVDLKRRLRWCKPRLHIYGHIHEDGGVFNNASITSANVTTAECMRGATVLDYNLATLVVTPVIVPRSWGEL